MFGNEVTETDAAFEVIPFLLGITTLHHQSFMLIGDNSGFINGERSETAQSGGTLAGSQRIAKQKLFVAGFTHQQLQA